MAYELRVNTGMVKVPVIDEDGEELGYIRFNPTDADIVKRYKEVVAYFKEIANNEGPEDDESIIKLADSVREKIDFLFNAKVSDTLFMKCGPFTPMESGDMYLQTVMDALEGLMTQVMDDRLAKMKKVEEATKEYN